MNTKMRGQRIGEVPEIEGSLPCLLFGKGTCVGAFLLKQSLAGRLNQ